MNHPLSPFAQRKIPGNAGCLMIFLFVWTAGIAFVFYLISRNNVVSKIHRDNDRDYDGAVGRS